ncbi:zinc-binding dehydrogenase [Nakamurella leprariae]|uniref:Alcohol dehydrogenase catalytic domain-containing protein n=1 Tax=Nakamurella leprariae TaxID=2803911 RepID=A0A938YCQ7_9ACTN|nr:alcohol dehydrogenase catalytic domain-containing protein [Nakamurella leprariae]MBM9466072.1 alcohol dehydrogenase catalytic domain-containing protein [Nakamurella leprariae]
MRATVWHGPEDVRFEEVPDPVLIAPSDALVRVVVACVCGSDLWRYRATTPPPSGPTRIGHEFVGVVEEVGSAVGSIKPGQLVIAPFVWSDGSCDFCAAGLQTSCRHGGGWGAQGDGGLVDGGQGEYVRVPQADGTLVAAPVEEHSELLPALLTLSDVMGTGHHAVVKAGVGAGSTVAVIGDGAVGLSAVLAAKRLGAERIVLFGRHEDRIAVARTFGVTDVIRERGDAATEQAAELTGGNGFASVAECVGEQAAWRTAMDIVRPGGTIGYVGVPTGVTEGLPVRPLFNKNVTVAGGIAPVRAYLPDLLAETLDGSLDPSPVFDLELPLAQVADGYSAMHERRSIKALLRA